MYRNAAIAMLALGLSLTAQAGDVFISKDARGNPVYTDRPESLPAQKVDIVTNQTDVVDARPPAAPGQDPYASQLKAFDEADKKAADARKATEATAADKAKRCQDARAQYQNVMNARRLYEDDDKGGRRYLDSAEIDKARADAKKLMDEFCSGL